MVHSPATHCQTPALTDKLAGPVAWWGSLDCTRQRRCGSSLAPRCLQGNGMVAAVLQACMQDL